MSADPLASGDPFAHGSISIGLHPPERLGAVDAVSAVLDQAARARGCEYDGVTISEHHVGFPGYLPQPLLIIVQILATLDRIWAGPGPILLGLRRPHLSAEEFAWARAAFPGRFGVAVAAGYATEDFVAAGLDPGAARTEFPAQLEALLAALHPDGPLHADAAVQAWAPTPLLLAAASSAAARRAAASGLGMLIPSGTSMSRLAAMAAAYQEAGGAGPVTLVKQVWLGKLPVGAVEVLQARYAAAAAPGERVIPAEVIHGDVDELVGRIGQAHDVLGSAAINLRVHLPDVGLPVVLDQLTALGERVVPRLRTRIAG